MDTDKPREDLLISICGGAWAFTWNQKNKLECEINDHLPRNSSSKLPSSLTCTPASSNRRSYKVNKNSVVCKLKSRNRCLKSLRVMKDLKSTPCEYDGEKVLAPSEWHCRKRYWKCDGFGMPLNAESVDVSDGTFGTCPVEDNCNLEVYLFPLMNGMDCTLVEKGPQSKNAKHRS